jgi:Leucine-rich repeat (LRR) protein
VLLRLSRIAGPRLGSYPHVLAPLSDLLAFHQTLDLSCNSLRDEGLSTILRSLAPPTDIVRRRAAPPPQRLLQLQLLDVSSNQAGAWGLRALHVALALGAMPKLQTLRLAHNNLRCVCVHVCMCVYM